MALRKFPNGDWRNRQQVEVWVDVSPEDAAQLDKDKIRKWTAEGIAMGMVSQAFIVYPRHRWTGADQCVSQFLGLELCHGLLSETFAQWQLRYHGADGSRAGQDCADPAGGPHLLGHGAVQEGGDDDGAGAGDGDADDQRQIVLHGGAGVAAPAQMPLAEDPSSTWVKENAEHRRKAREWIDSNPLN
eukprot:9284678-Pyramimonas_sp.AAC.1